MKFLSRKLKNLKVSSKLAIITICFACILWTLLVAVLQISFSIFSERLYQNSLRELEFFSDSVNDGLREIEAQSYNLAMHQATQELLAEMKGTYPSFSYTKSLNQVRRILLNSWDVLSPVRSIGYIDPSGTKIEVGTSSWDVSGEAMDGFMALARERHGAFVTYGPTEDCPYLLTGRVILNWPDMSMDYLGTLYLVCDVADIIQSNKTELAAENAYVFVRSQTDVVYEDPALDGSLQLPEYETGSGYEIMTWNGERYFLCYLNSAETDWMYISLFLYSDIYGNIQWSQRLLMLLVILLTPILLWITNRIAKAITSPLEELVTSMQIVEHGDFGAALNRLEHTDRQDEIGLLSKEFYIMLEQVNDLIQENYEKQLLLKDTQYKMLRAQINPHFLYNTLNTLNWTIKAGRNMEASKMTVQLGALLRYAFVEEPHATVEEEVRNVESYIAIQKMRFQDRIDFSVETCGPLFAYTMPRMLLQPLVENAIVHGAASQAHCKIRVTASAGSDGLLLRVEDTGAGIDEDVLEKIRALKIQAKHHGIGLKNIFERLNGDYGPESYSISSTVGQGTVIQIRIPEKRRHTDVQIDDRG